MGGVLGPMVTKTVTRLIPDHDVLDVLMRGAVTIILMKTPWVIRMMIASRPTVAPVRGQGSVVVNVHPLPLDPDLDLDLQGVVGTGVMEDESNETLVVDVAKCSVALVVGVDVGHLVYRLA